MRKRIFRSWIWI